MLQWCLPQTLTLCLQPPPSTPTSTRLSGIEPNSIDCHCTMQYRFSVQHLQRQCHTIDRSEEIKATTTWIYIKDDNGLRILAETVQQVYSEVVVASVNRWVRTLNGQLKCMNGSWDKVVSKSMLRKICSVCQTREVQTDRGLGVGGVRECWSLPPGSMYCTCPPGPRAASQWSSALWSQSTVELLRFAAVEPRYRTQMQYVRMPSVAQWQ